MSKPSRQRPAEIAGREQHERGDAERLQQHRVDQQPEREPADGADDGAAEQAERDDDTGRMSGVAPSSESSEKNASWRTTPSDDQQRQPERRSAG